MKALGCSLYISKNYNFWIVTVVYLVQVFLYNAFVFKLCSLGHLSFESDHFAVCPSLASWYLNSSFQLFVEATIAIILDYQCGIHSNSSCHVGHLVFVKIYCQNQILLETVSGNGGQYHFFEVFDLFLWMMQDLLEPLQ